MIKIKAPCVASTLYELENSPAQEVRVSVYSNISRGGFIAIIEASKLNEFVFSRQTRFTTDSGNLEMFVDHIESCLPETIKDLFEVEE